MDKRREATRTAIIEAAWEVVHEQGLAALTLRAVAERVGMRAPSLYSHFDSKNAIVDAMFGQAWSTYEADLDAVDTPAHPRAALRASAHHFVDFAVADLPRHQLMNLRTIPDFTPSVESYAPAVRVLEWLRDLFVSIGLDADADADLFIALMAGLVDQQWANDPGGDRWTRQIDRAVEMFADAVGLPKEQP
jgi:AcrR family transcriptional regulator